MSTQKKSRRKFGFNSGGEFETYVDKKQTVEYLTWCNMMSRCYSPSYLAKYSNCADCLVTDDWLDYQGFAEWLSAHEFHNLGYCLDKDILVKGNKLYSSDTCLLIPHELNTLILSKRKKEGDCPIGVSRKQNRYQVCMSIGGKTRFFGYYDCPYEAHEVYLVQKKKNIIDVANKWRGRIEDKAYDALMNWEVSN